MPIQIEINDAHTELLVEFYLTRLKTLRDEVIEKEKEMKDITQNILKLKKKTPNDGEFKNVDNRPSEYSDKWPWVKKIHFAISTQNRPLTTKEIVDALTEFEPSFIFDRKRVVASISSTLSTKSGDGKEFVRVERDSGEFAYHLTPEEGMPGYNFDISLDLDKDSLPF